MVYLSRRSFFYGRPAFSALVLLSFQDGLNIRRGVDPFRVPFSGSPGSDVRLNFFWISGCPFLLKHPVSFRISLNPLLPALLRLFRVFKLPLASRYARLWVFFVTFPVVFFLCLRVVPVALLCSLDCARFTICSVPDLPMPGGCGVEFRNRLSFAALGAGFHLLQVIVVGLH